ncbi:MAG TPA: Asp-tRNA(Asn)/Glu-tRNA(Gln) amidotransferase subunit GatC [Candidatus Nanoarchaeia archaeon]|nr:Asp-tRNA(Asn)/Glu-tRNA(Gln) amidotransferase subunit GatC [Candidatus Nanoarchaeia archaeon]
MVDESLVRKVAGIARLSLSDEEVKTFTRQFDDIISWFNEISEIDTKGVEPSFHPLKTENVFRDDVVKPCLTQEESLVNTSHKEGGFFKGPRAV